MRVRVFLDSHRLRRGSCLLPGPSCPGPRRRLGGLLPASLARGRRAGGPAARARAAGTGRRRVPMALLSPDGRDVANAITLVGLAAVGLTLILCGYPGGWI